MAGDRDRMAELEDGELESDHESDMRDAATERVQVSSFRSTGPALSAVSGYRSYRTTDSSDSNSGSEDEALPWRHKRLKCSGAPVSAAPHARSAAGPFARKVNNIWGSVVQEQSQEAVAAELGIMGMEGSVSMSSRQSETYNYVLARRMMEKEREEEEEGLKSMLDGELEGYMQQKERDQEEKSCLKRKRPAKERLGPRAEMDVKGRYELREDDPDQRVVDEIAHRLMEPKKDLIERVVRVIGKKKAIELLSETATIEQNGGLYTVDGSRRRTPGGVYLNLLKNTASISDGQVKVRRRPFVKALRDISIDLPTEALMCTFTSFSLPGMKIPHLSVKFTVLKPKQRPAFVDRARHPLTSMAPSLPAGQSADPQFNFVVCMCHQRLTPKRSEIGGGSDAPRAFHAFLDASCGRTLKREIFHEENQKEYNNKKAAKKRRKRIVAKKMKQAISTLNLQEHDDVSRETFASDTEEALGSLEEAPEGPSESALGTEDNPVVYNSNDLEVF
ncbi:hypothetical protein M9458_054960 [Cirrhinus mrigala]|uniref:Phosphorylated adapter RNA export protein n=1 Tax=Cirrhinus mrigala TaxID=683832 RepID=A0ABD0MJG8_CIRMR